MQTGQHSIRLMHHRAGLERPRPCPGLFPLFFALIVIGANILLFFIEKGLCMDDKISSTPASTVSHLYGHVKKINVKERYFEIETQGGKTRKASKKTLRVYVDDPSRLRALRSGLRVKVLAEKSRVAEGAFMAREIMMPGARCRCDPTGVRFRMRRAMGMGGWSCGGWNRATGAAR